LLIQNATGDNKPQAEWNDALELAAEMAESATESNETRGAEIATAIRGFETMSTPRSAEPVAWADPDDMFAFELSREPVVKQGVSWIPLYAHPPTSVEPDERARFEAWWRNARTVTDGTFEPDDYSGYIDIEVHDAWCIWQAAIDAALAAKEQT